MMPVRTSIPANKGMKMDGNTENYLLFFCLVNPKYMFSQITLIWLISRTTSYQRRYKKGTSSSLVYYTKLKKEILALSQELRLDKNVVDTILDRNPFKVGGHWPLWRGQKENESPSRTDTVDC